MIPKIPAAILSLLCIVLIGFSLYFKAAYLPESQSALHFIQAFSYLREQHPFLVVLIFSLLHIVASIIGFPGGLTVLNITAGAIWGFWGSCIFVYLLSLFSGTFGYFLGFNLDRIFGRRSQKIVSCIHEAGKRIRLNDGFLALVLARLNPVLPFGILSMGLGALRVPFSVFFFSTAVGIFFDVTLLCGLGHALAMNAEAPRSLPLIPVFLGLLIIYLLFSRLMARSRWLSRAVPVGHRSNGPCGKFGS